MIKNRTKKNNSIPKLCHFEYEGFEPKENAYLLCCSLFKMKSMYNDITFYINGLKKLLDFIEENNKGEIKFHLILHYDHTIENDDKFKNIKNYILNNLNFVKLVKYYCPLFIENNFHKGIFGMFVRLYPIFEGKYKNHIKHIIDVDFDESSLNYYLNIISRLVKDNDNKLFINMKIGYEWNYRSMFLNQYTQGTCLGNFIIKNETLPMYLLENFLIKLRNNDPKILAILTKMILLRNQTSKNPKKIKKFGEQINTFTYGIDEYFVNTTIINYCIKKYKKIGIFYCMDSLSNYINIIDWMNIDKDLALHFFKDLLKNNYSNDIHSNIKKLENILNFDDITHIQQYNIKYNKLKDFNNVLNKYKEKIPMDKEYYRNLQRHFITKNMINISFIKKNKNIRDKLLNNLKVSTLRLR